MPAMPEQMHEASACQAAFLARLSTLDKSDLEAVVELFQCLESAVGDDRPEIAKAIIEILNPRVIYARLGTDKPIAADARQRVGDYRRKVGKRIGRRRQELGMTQEQLAEAAGIPQSHVSRLECGKHAPTHITIERIAKALSVEPGWLDPGCDD